MHHIPEEIIERVEKLKKKGKFNDALKIINHILMKEPTNKQALLQVADIEYRQWSLDKAVKPIDFLLSTQGSNDPMNLYIKGVIEMEKNNWWEAKKFLQDAIKLTHFENHEIVRCYGLCEYRYGNREKWIMFVEQAYDLNNLDAEVIYNLIELYLLEKRYKKAKTMIQYYFKKQKKIMTFDKSKEYYDNKINLFKEFIQKY